MCVWVKLYNVTSCVVDGFLRAIETVEASNDKRVFLQNSRRSKRNITETNSNSCV